MTGNHCRYNDMSIERGADEGEVASCSGIPYACHGGAEDEQ